MKEFILINRVPVGYGQTEAKEVAAAWTQLTDEWKQAGKFITSFVFPAEGSIAFGQPVGISFGNVVADDLKTVSVIVIKADNLSNGAEMAKASPILRQAGSVRDQGNYGQTNSSNFLTKVNFITNISCDIWKANCFERAFNNSQNAVFIESV